jgi:gliding motility-associated-like protein
MVLFSAVMAQAPHWKWIEAVYGPGRLYAYDVAVESFTGEAVIVGAWQPDVSPFWGDNSRPSTDFSVSYGAADGFIARYDTMGNMIWAFKIGGPSMDEVRSVAIDPGGDIYITGKIGDGLSNFAGTFTLTADSTLSNADNTDCFIAKYNRAGALIWLRSSLGSDIDVSGEAISANQTDVFIAGDFTGNLTLGSYTFPVTARNKDVFLAKYDQEGNLQWITAGGSLTEDQVNGLEVDDLGVFFIGNFTYMTMEFYDVSGGVTDLINNRTWGWEDAFIAGYDVNGNLLWAGGIGSDYIDFGNGIAIDSDYVYATGGIYNNAYFPGYSGNPVHVSDKMDIFLSRHDRSTGLTSWLRVIPSVGTQDDFGYDIDIDISKNLYITGVYENTLNFFGDTSLASSGGQEIFLTSFTADGTYNWAKTAGSSANQDAGYSVASRNGDGIYVTGTYDKEGIFDTIILSGANNSNIFLGSLQTGFADYTSPPGNDHPCSAFLLPVGDTCNASIHNNNYATDSGIPDPGCGDYAGGDVWFKAVIPPSGNLFVGTNTSEDDTYPPSNGWMYRVNMAVYSGTCGSLQMEGCYSCNSAYHYRASSAYLFDKNPGDTVWIRIWDNLGVGHGFFSICAFDTGHYPAWDLPGNLCAGDGIMDLDTTILDLVSGYADALVDFSGIQDPDNILDEADGAAAKLFQNGDWIKVDLTDTIPTRAVYQILFHSHTVSTGVTRMTIWASFDDVSYYPHSFKPETDLDTTTSYFILAEHPTRFLLIKNDNAAGGGFAVDGIEYAFSGTSGGTWSGPGVTGSYFDPSGLTGPVPITYSVGGSTNRTDSTRIINIQGSQGGILGPDTAVCPGHDMITLRINDFSGSILKWESTVDGFSSTASLLISDSILAVSDLTETTQYRVIVQDGSCEPDTSNRITVAVHFPSRANLSGDTTICNGSAATLKVGFTGIPPWDFAYENDVDTITLAGIMGNPYEFNVSPSAITDYSLVGVVDGNGCNGLLSGSARVEPIPIANPGKDSTLCGLVFKFDTVTGIGPGIWSQLSGPGTAVFTPGAEYRDAEVMVDTYGAYEFNWTQTEGTCVHDSTVTIEFFESPLADAGTGSSVCGLRAGLQAIPSVGNGIWSMLSGPGTASFVPGLNEPNVLVSVSTGGSYEFMWTEANGPCQDTATIEVDFYQQPQLMAFNGGDVCGLSFQLEAFTDAGEGTWSKSAGPGQAIFVSGAASSITAVTVDAYGSYTFTWTVSNGSCSDSIAVWVNFVAEITVDAGTDSDVCGLGYRLAASPAIWSGYWEKIAGPGNVTFLPADNASNVTVTVDAYGVYEFQWMEATADCSGRDNVMVSFHEQPVADAGPDQVLDHVFSTFLEANIPAYGTGNWELVKGTGQIQAKDDPGSRVTDLSLGENEFKWTITSPVCEDVSDDVLITVMDIQPPTVITPNNDGFNDHLVFSGISELDDSEIIIYSRWGNELYRNEDYRNDWDGRDQNGRELPLDTYYYILKLSSGRLIKGFVEIRR